MSNGASGGRLVRRAQCRPGDHDDNCVGDNETNAGEDSHCHAVLVREQVINGKIDAQLQYQMVKGELKTTWARDHSPMRHIGSSLVHDNTPEQAVLHAVQAVNKVGLPHSHGCVQSAA